MQIEIYNMITLNNKLNISLEAVCDSFSSLLWDIEYYKCGEFEVYIAAIPRIVRHVNKKSYIPSQNRSIRHIQRQSFRLR